MKLPNVFGSKCSKMLPFKSSAISKILANWKLHYLLHCCCHTILFHVTRVKRVRKITRKRKIFNIVSFLFFFFCVFLLTLLMVNEIAFCLKAAKLLLLSLSSSSSSYRLSEMALWNANKQVASSLDNNVKLKLAWLCHQWAEMGWDELRWAEMSWDRWMNWLAAWWQV